MMVPDDTYNIYVHVALYLHRHLYYLVFYIHMFIFYPNSVVVMLYIFIILLDLPQTYLHMNYSRYTPAINNKDFIRYNISDLSSEFVILDAM